MQLDYSREQIPLSAPFTITGYTFTEIAVVVADAILSNWSVFNPVLPLR